MSALSPAEQAKARASAPWLYAKTLSPDDPAFKYFYPKVQIDDQGRMFVGLAATPALKLLQMKQALTAGNIRTGNAFHNKQTWDTVREDYYRFPESDEARAVWFGKYGEKADLTAERPYYPAHAIRSDDATNVMMVTGGLAGLRAPATLAGVSRAVAVDAGWNIGLEVASHQAEKHLGRDGALAAHVAVLATLLARRALMPRASWARPPAAMEPRKAGAVALQASEFDPRVAVYRHQPGPPPLDPEMAVVNQRLEAMKTILSDEVDRLKTLKDTGKISKEEYIRLNNIGKHTCAEAAIEAERAAAGHEPRPVDVNNARQLDSREIRRRVDGDASYKYTGNPADLHEELARALPQKESRAIVVINRTDTKAGHVFNVENINDRIWLFEAHDGIAIPLHGQPADVVGVQALYPLGNIGGYDVIITHSDVRR
ncbi:hypothetical protein [Fimbriiglobus ruber]|uniref:Uncharacterized protein n=1 Tax=Fimbriiglobus ruber TaxID=1908690 RepID=A0A225DWR2_9BACT|nr:hypothetical protein [Fimbriiglobus ruber]OWK45791.1 hypothetical protein FRUB_02122 [Fimbriiglobus ruber]